MLSEPNPVDPFSTSIVKATAEPLSEGGQKLLATLLGGVGEEIRAYFKDRAILWRAGRGIYTVERSVEMLAAAGLKPKPVKMKPLLNIMESATMEDDDDLSEMWAALLANASVSDLRGTESSGSVQNFV